MTAPKELRSKLVNVVEAFKEDMEHLSWCIRERRSPIEIRDAVDRLEGWDECIRTHSEEYLKAIESEQ